MPNTLAHIGANLILTRSLIKKADAFLVFVGAIIPDIPWILQRLANFFIPNINTYDLRLYCVVQASLVFSIILCTAIALLFQKPLRVFAILSFGALIHLLLDSIEKKWANGVHLFAPINWGLFNIGIVWPEHIIIHLISILGLMLFLLLFRETAKTSFNFNLENKIRILLSISILFLYIFLPFIFVDNAEYSDNHFVKTLRDYDERSGKYFEIDRGNYINSLDGDKFLTPFNEYLSITNLDLETSEVMSIRAEFVTPNTIKVIEYRIHGNRDIYSYIGLGLILIVFLLKLYQGKKLKPY